MIPQGDEPQVRPADTDALIDEALKVPLTWHPRSEAEQRSFEAVFYVWTHLADALARERQGWRLVERYCEHFPDDWRLVFRKGDSVIELSVSEQEWRTFDE